MDGDGLMCDAFLNTNQINSRVVAEGRYIIDVNAQDTSFLVLRKTTYCRLPMPSVAYRFLCRRACFICQGRLSWDYLVRDRAPLAFKSSPTDSLFSNFLAFVEVCRRNEIVPES